jgi:DNA-binding HxlR family transcriptional regulator
MYTKKIEEDLDCGLRIGFKIFGGKWKMCILDAINKGIIRPADIHRSMPEATLRVIEMQLAELLLFGIVDKIFGRCISKENRIQAYRTRQSILPILSQIDKWGTENSAFVKERLQELEEAR